MRDTNDERQRKLEEFYASLSPQERRRRVILEPAYRDAYNEITEAHRIVPVPNYFWENWLPVLGPVACALYIQLRRYCYHNPDTGEKRDLCWPKQDTLAREIGVKDRKTVRKGLAVLEEHGFIERERTYYRDATSGRPHQGTDRYRIFFEVPLTVKDAAELLIRRTTPEETDFVPRAYGGRKSPHRVDPVDNSHYEGKKSSHGGGEKIPTRTSTRTITPNVNNVETTSWEPETAKTKPVTTASSTPNREAVRNLALEIGETLKTWSGGWDGEAHESEGFHRRVAQRMPEKLIREALIATRDAVDRRRAGQGGCARPEAYFAGVVKNLAEDHGIDLGLNPPGKRSEPPPKSARMVTTAPKPPSGPTEPDEALMSAQEAKEAIRGLLEKLDAEKVARRQ